MKIFSLQLILLSGLFFVIEPEAMRAPTPARIAFPNKVKQSFYPAEGASPQELKASLMQRGPIGHGSKRFFAYTLWHFKEMSGELSCYVSLHRPSLYPTKSQSLELKEIWKSFDKNLAAHESRHIKNALRTCRHLQRLQITNARLESAAARLQKRDDRYDQHSNHGHKEGVRLF